MRADTREVSSDACTIRPGYWTGVRLVGGNEAIVSWRLGVEEYKYTLEVGVLQIGV